MSRAWRLGAWSQGAWAGTVWADRERGVSATFSQGQFAAFGVTVALSGAACTASAGTLQASKSGQVATFSQGSIASVSVDRALTGTASTGATGSVGVLLRPTDIVGQAITSARGTVSAGGQDKTVHISGVEATFAYGSVQGGYTFLSGAQSTSGLSAPTVGIDMPLTGLSAALFTGPVSAAQDADDTYILSTSGATTAAVACLLVGVASAGGQGTVAISSDAYAALTGAQTDSAAGALVADMQPALIGLQSDGAQYFLGAPGGVTLSGSAVAVIAGDVFTTGDREYPLTGAVMTALGGVTFASPVAFVAGQEIAAAIEGLGPRTVGISGVEMVAETGNIEPPRRAARASGFSQPQQRRNYIIKGKKYYGLTLDELQAILQELEDIEREDVQVKSGQNKPHVISKTAWDQVKPEEEVEAELLLL